MTRRCDVALRRSVIDNCGVSYEEKRVRLSAYGPCPAEHLRPIASVEGKACRLHVLAAESFARMAEQVKIDIGVDLLAASGYRPQRFATRAAYDTFVISKYGSVAEGHKWLAFQSPHTTGLAIDFESGGLEPARATAEKQRATPLHAWLVERAYEYGWHPYKREPWHWEHPLPLVEFRSGKRSAPSTDA